MRLEALKFLYDIQHVHGYYIVRGEVVWGVLENELATLTREVGSLIERETYGPGA
jgi:hypothetical protein